MTVSYKMYKIKDFVRRTETGEINIQKSLNAVAELAVASKLHKDINILIDLRDTETTLNFGDLLTVALEFAWYKDCFRNKIAVVIPNDPERIKRGEYLKANMKVKGFSLITSRILRKLLNGCQKLDLYIRDWNFLTTS